MTDSHVVVMGVAGSGKSTVGAELAQCLSRTFVEGDDYHLPRSREKMAAGIPLDDGDRFPWLDALNRYMQASTSPLVLSCSALKQGYRERLADGLTLVFLYLEVSQEVVKRRIESREHFMPVSLVESQFAALEAPVGDNVLTIDGDRDLDIVTRDALGHLLQVL